MRRSSGMRALAAVFASLAVASPSAAWTAPGRVVYPVTRAPIGDINAGLFGAGPAVALPDGGVVIALGDTGTSVALHALRADGSPDTLFGRGGVARIGGLPDAGVVSFEALQVLRRPDGRFLVLGSGAPASKYRTGRVVVAAFTADGERDRSFGGGDGVVQTPIDTSCTCTRAALAPDGSLVLTGMRPWIVGRLTPAGAMDAGFGDHGVLAVPGVSGQNVSGLAVSVLGDGRIVSLGEVGGVGRLVRLMPDGTVDPSFDGGHVLKTAVLNAAALAVGADATTTVGGSGAVRRFAGDGSVDTSFGDGGTVQVPTGSVRPIGFAEGPDGTVYGYGGDRSSTYAGTDGGVDITPLDGPGALRRHRTALAFGGGTASTFRTFHVDFPLPPLTQTGFTLGTVVARPDGSFLAIGSIAIVQYSGEGVGRSSGQLAVAAIAPDHRLDASFGGPRRALRLAISVPVQTAAAAHEAHAIEVRVRSSTPGLVLLRVRDLRGRVLAQQVEPVYRPGTATYGVQVPHTRVGRLRTAAGLRLVAGARMRDVLGARATAAALGRLR